METRWVGTAPFCDPNPSQCEATPGYIATGKDKCGNGACCWSGEKIKCEFNDKAWKSSQLYSEMIAENGQKAENIKPQFVWMGKAPACAVEACDVFAAGLVPVKNSTCGDGSCCFTGEKWLGMKPILQSHKDLVKTGMKECFEFKKLQEQTLQAGLGFGAKAISAIGSVAGKII